MGNSLGNGLDKTIKLAAKEAKPAAPHGAASEDAVLYWKSMLDEAKEYER